MTNFKSGAGNLDFDDDADDQQAESSASTVKSAGGDDSGRGEPATGRAVQSDAGTGTEAADDGPASTGETYPYFVRRSNVGDERDTRLEIHVRDKVAEGEAGFRHDLAAELGASDVSKTDAREFALLAAYRHPDRVAELMREEGFDSLG